MRKKSSNGTGALAALPGTMFHKAAIMRRSGLMLSFIAAHFLKTIAAPGESCERSQKSAALNTGS